MGPSIAALLVSLVVNLCGMLANYLAFNNTNYLWLSFKMWGGECMSESGFGLRVFHVYGMTPDQATSHSLSFDPVNLVVQVVVVAVVARLVMLVIAKVRHR